MYRVLNAESSSCVEFVSAAAFLVSRCVRVETVGYDVKKWLIIYNRASNLRNAFNMTI